VSKKAKIEVSHEPNKCKRCRLDDAIRQAEEL
jgi:hypothetical protein